MAIREIVFDTETTGLDPLGGDRIVEIGCVEMINHIPTGRTFHVYINPERDMPQGAFAVHGLSSEFLADKPLFAAVADDFLAFIGDARLVAHNAAFDIGFLNAELGRLGHPPHRRRPGRRHAARWRGASTPAPATASTRCASATGSTIPAAPSTARCSTPRSWPKSISS